MSSKRCPNPKCGKEAEYIEGSMKTYYECPHCGHKFEEEATDLGVAVNVARGIGTIGLVVGAAAALYDWFSKRDRENQS